MEESKKKVYKYARSISKVCSVSMILVIVFVGFSFGMLIDIFIRPKHAKTIAEMYSGITDEMAGMDNDWDIPMKYQAMIAVLVTILFAVMIYCFFKFVRRITRMMLDGDTPFTEEIANSTRKMAFFSLLFILADPFVCLIAFLICMMFSALFDYGAYLQAKADQTNRIQEEMIVSFAEITENKSTQTGNHVKRVSEYSKILAKEMGLSEEECERIRLASTMHDIGKLLIPAQILEKPARLTDEEFNEIKKHSAYGGMLLESVEGDVMQLARTIALDHHERPDGKGYPDGKTGESISLEGRIVAVADVYDALTSKRSYKQAWKPEIAYDEIVKNSGSQFDEQVVRAFKAVYPEIEKTRESYSDRSKLTFKPLS